MTQPRAGVVVTGTEVLTGRVRDANGPWLAGELRAVGFDLVHLTISRDRSNDIVAQLEFMRDQKLDLIVTTGGLGPTADDMTTAIVAEFCERELVLDEPLLVRIETIIRPYADRYGWEWGPLAEGARKQAMVPVGAAVLGPAGTAPGLVVESPANASTPTVVVLPGPPRELRPIWGEAVTTEQFRRVAQNALVYEEQMLRMTGVPEPEIARTLREFDDDHGLEGLEITTCLRAGELEMLISHAPGQRPQREALMELIEHRHGERIFSRDDSTVDEQVIEMLGDRKLALAESCTGGLIAKRLTDGAGASRYFAGGVVSYSDDAKVAILGVEPALLAAHGSVSAEVARAMAEGALSAFNADFAISVTGVAGPGGGSVDKPVGTVFVHVVDDNGRYEALQLELPGRRGDVRDRSASFALHALRRLLSS